MFTCTRTLQPDESQENEIILTNHKKLKVEIYFAVLDKLKIELQMWSSGYELMLLRFGFLLNICGKSVTTANLK